MSGARPDTWMPLYVGDYLRDTMHLTTVQHGAYMLLLMAAWTRGGELPASDAQLAGIARLTPKAWADMKPVLSAFFHISETSWQHGRVDREISKAKRMTEAKAEAGKKGSQRRWQKDGEPIAEPSDSHRQTDAPSPSPSPSPSVAKATGAEAPLKAEEISRETPAPAERDAELLDLPSHLRKSDDPWKDVYAGFKRHLGNKSGGLITKLRGLASLDEMRGWLKELDSKEIGDAREYFGGVIAKREAGNGRPWRTNGTAQPDDGLTPAVRLIIAEQQALKDAKGAA
jgi:uncharacterized protein YdaU (DUF1376 family)